MITGTGFYIWKVRACEGGDVGRIVSLAKSAGLSHLLVKVTDGPYRYNRVNGVDYAGQLVKALKAAGIQAWGWGYVYGSNPDGEAAAAVRAVVELDLDGFVVDAEAEWKKPGMGLKAVQYMTLLRSGIGADLPVALSTYRWPTYHREFPFTQFLEQCDFAMPQVYWLQSHNPGFQLERCLREYAALPIKKPVFPTGACYREHNWQPSSAEISEFISACKSLGLQGCNFWEWANARAYVLDGWNTISHFRWDVVSIKGLTARVLVSGLRVRSQPNLSGEIITTIRKGDTVQITDFGGVNTWAQIGQGQWAAAQVGEQRYLEVSDA
jgi:hypothetical protein